MVKIRLARQGAKKNPQYQVVVLDQQKPRDGEYLEKLGYYYPQAEKDSEKLKINKEAYSAWMAKGAQCTPRLAQLVKTLGKHLA